MRKNERGKEVTLARRVISKKVDPTPFCCFKINFEHSNTHQICSIFFGNFFKDRKKSYFWWVFVSARGRVLNKKIVFHALRTLTEWATETCRRHFAMNYWDLNALIISLIINILVTNYAHQSSNFLCRTQGNTIVRSTDIGLSKFCVRTVRNSAYVHLHVAFLIHYLYGIKYTSIL